MSRFFGILLVALSASAMDLPFPPLDLQIVAPTPRFRPGVVEEPAWARAKPIKLHRLDYIEFGIGCGDLALEAPHGPAPLALLSDVFRQANKLEICLLEPLVDTSRDFELWRGHCYRGFAIARAVTYEDNPSLIGAFELMSEALMGEEVDDSWYLACLDRQSIDDAIGESRFRPSIAFTFVGHKIAHVAYDLSARLVLLESDGKWGFYRLDEITSGALEEISARLKQEPNQAPEPTATLVTPRAGARVAPSAAVAHL